MNGFWLKKYILTLALVVVPVVVGAQTFSYEISNIIWGTPIPTTSNPNITTDTSITVRGQMAHTNNPAAPYRFQLEYGFPGDVTEVGQLGAGASVAGYGPLLTSTEYLDAQNNFQMIVTNLWPSQYYYFDILEWDMTSTAGEPLHDYYIARTKKPENVTINFSTFQNGSSTLSGVVSLTSNYTPGVMAGMPIGVYVLSTPSTGDVIDQSTVLATFPMTVGPSGSFSVPVTYLQLNQQYYLQLRNENSDLPLTDSIPFMFNDQNTPPVVDDGGDGGTGPQFPDSGEEFNDGLTTCDGIVVECTFEKLLLLVNKVLRFLIFIIGVPIVTLSFAYAGFLMVTSGGNSGKKEEAKKIITSATIGLVVLLAAWLIVRTVLLVFGYSGPLLGILGA